jgi:uncharacterized membrane protein YdfJ with MMPL/SSD domain
MQTFVPSEKTTHICNFYRRAPGIIRLFRSRLPEPVSAVMAQCIDITQIAFFGITVARSAHAAWKVSEWLTFFISGAFLAELGWDVTE